MVLNETFGATGTAVTYFGGQWWLVGLFLILIFVVFALAYKASADVIILVTITGLLTAGSYQLFVIDEQITQTIVFFIFIFIASFAYLWFTR